MLQRNQVDTETNLKGGGGGDAVRGRWTEQQRSGVASGAAGGCRTNRRQDNRTAPESLQHTRIDSLDGLTTIRMDP